MFAFLHEGTPGRPIVEDSDGPATPAPARRLERPLAKSKNPEYAKTGVYLKVSTLRALKSRLAGDEMSNLFEELASEWLKQDRSK
jgi:hypothetical protein